jgi:hypothetical protein
MKKITLLFALLISSIGVSQEVLQNFESGGLGDPFGGAAASVVADPETGGTRGSVAMLTASSSQEVWQGINIELTKNVDLTTSKTMSLDVYSDAAITIAPQVKSGLDGAPDSTGAVSHTGSGWETLTLTFDQGLNSTTTANGVYGLFVIYYNWDASTTTFISPAVDRVFYVDNVTGIGVDPVPDAVPTTAAPTPSARNAWDVVSLFSNAYTDKTGVTFGTDWDSADISDVTVAGDDVKKVVFSGSEASTFLGVDFSAALVDATEFTHFHIDLWTATETADKSFNLKLPNFGNGSFPETNAIEASINNSNSLPSTNPGTWISLDIPFTSWTIAGGGSAARESLAQFLITSNLGVSYIDNIYMYRAATASVDKDNLLNVSLSPSPATNELRISAQDVIKNVTIYNVLGKTVVNAKINKKEDIINVSSLNTGIYILKYTVNNAVGTMKFIKE